LKDIKPGTGQAIFFGGFRILDGTLYFVANDGTSGVELWKSDGTTPGTTLFDDITGDGTGSKPKYLTVANGRLFVDAATEQYGREIWVADPTALTLPGDYDLDNDVDNDDYAFWKQHFGETNGVGLQADGNDDGIVNAADYTVWRNNLGATAPGAGAGSAASPEPTEPQAVIVNELSPTVTDVAITQVAARRFQFVFDSEVGQPRPPNGGVLGRNRAAIFTPANNGNLLTVDHRRRTVSLGVVNNQVARQSAADIGAVDTVFADGGADALFGGIRRYRLRDPLSSPR